MPEDKKKKAEAINSILKRLFPKAGIALHFKTPWECMVAVQLSAQCTDKKVNEVTANLFKKYPKLDDYAKADLRTFEHDIRATGFYHNKAKNIIAAAKMVRDKWHGKLPCTLEEMLTIPGVGRKTANVVLYNVCHVISGLAVDTHVRRLSQDWGLTKNTDPDKIEQDLTKLLPKKEWPGWTYRVIDYGRQYAPARKKDHSDEPLAKYYK